MENLLQQIIKLLTEGIKSGCVNLYLDNAVNNTDPEEEYEDEDEDYGDEEVLFVIEDEDDQEEEEQGQYSPQEEVYPEMQEINGRLVSKESIQRLQMQADYLMTYLKDNHYQLYKNTAPYIQVTEGGEILLHVTEEGFDYYKDHKQELYTNIYNKSGCHHIHLNVKDTALYVQIDPDNLRQNIGQFLPFGSIKPKKPKQTTMSKPKDQDPSELLRDFMENFAAPEPLITLDELCKEIPPEIRNVKLTLEDVANIFSIVYQRSVLGLLSKVNTESKKQQS